MNAPPPPPPPPPAAPKASIPANNKALLSSIEKGTKLKKVPESLKNDRSGAAMSGGKSRNAPQSRPVNGNYSAAESKQPSLPPNFASIQSELANHISLSSSNLKKPASNPVIRQPLKSNVPAPNQFTAVNKPPPPPPMNKKPNLVTKKNSVSEDVRRLSMPPNNNERLMFQNPVTKKPQPPLPYQQNSNIQTKSQVTRVTSNPPPPLSNSQIEVSRVHQQINAPPPPVPQRVPHQPTSSSPQLIQNRSSSYGGQYKVFDRPPPPPPPPTTSVTNNQRYSSFDRRFAFPDEKNFPNVKRVGSCMPGSRFSPSFSVEANSY